MTPVEYYTAYQLLAKSQFLSLSRKSPVGRMKHLPGTMIDIALRKRINNAVHFATLQIIGSGSTVVYGGQPGLKYPRLYTFPLSPMSPTGRTLHSRLLDMFPENV